MTDNTDTMAPVWSAVRALLITVGSALAANGYGDSHVYKIVELAAGTVMIVGPAAWGVWTAFQNTRKKKELVTTAVNAERTRAAVEADPVRTTEAGTPLPATPAEAHDIVKTFG